MSAIEADSGEPPAISSQATSHDASMPADSFRWQSLFQRAGDAVFVLSRRRRFLFVNRAWEKLTGISAQEAHGLACVRRSPLPHDPPDVVVRSLCSPSPEALRGLPSRLYRLFPGTAGKASRWTIDYFPVCNQESVLFIVGRIHASDLGGAVKPVPLPETLSSLRQKARQRYGLESLSSNMPVGWPVAEQVRLAAQIRLPVVLQGEAGTGKTWVARTIHALAAGPEEGFAAIDCGRLPSQLVASLFFAEKTGGAALRVGWLYLREPGRLNRDIQVELARTLAGKEEDAPRLMVGSHTNLEDEMRVGRIHEEFFALTSTFTIRLLPLRNRLPDLPLLTEKMLERINASRDKPVQGLAADAWEVFRAYAWPGNLRELYKVLQGASAHLEGDHVEAKHLPWKLRTALETQGGDIPEATRKVSLDEVLEAAERRLILSALRKAGGNRTKAAELLSIWRPRLLRRMQALGIETDSSIEGENHGPGRIT
jgi:transcriptional regulator with PAS, ATPase and Fis domain